MSAALNIVGLIMNLAGVILLFQYGMPYRVRTDGRQTRVLMGADEATIKAERRYNRLGFVGLALIILGTASQIAAVSQIALAVMAFPDVGSLARDHVSREWIATYAEIGTAIGTIGAVIVALGLAGMETRRRVKADKRSQAEQISGWMVDDLPPPQTPRQEHFVRLILQNASNQLVYNLIATIVSAQSGTPSRFRKFVGRLPPGKSEYEIEHPGYGMHKRNSIELAFEDSRGRYWRRTGKGRLERVWKEPLALYDIDPPVGWEMP